MSQPLLGFVPLLHAAAKQSRHLIAPWVVLITLLCVTSFFAYFWIFPDDTQRQALAQSIQGNPAFNLIFGVGHNLATIDGFAAWRSLALGSFFAGLMAITIVVRETRAKEDSGEAEMVGSNVVGRYTQLAVGVALAWMASLALGVVSATSMILLGGDVRSSLLLASALTASGVMFAGVAAVTAQLGAYAGTASSLATAFLGLCFLVRGYADTSPDADWALWATPLGWLQKIEPSGAQQAWPLLLAAGFALSLALLAGALASRRDFAHGLLPTRRGAARAKLVGNLFGLAWRLQQGSIITWTVGFILLGTVFGFLVSSLGDVFTQSAAIARLLGRSGTQTNLVFEFAGTILKLLGIIAAVYGVGVMMRYYKEESEGRIEPLLAGAVPRVKAYASHVVIALLGPATALVLGAGMIAFVTQAQGLDISAADLIKQAIIEIPAVWVLVGISVAVIGNHPVARFGAWMAVVVTFALTILGPLFKLWDWILGISPLWHVPNVVASEPDWIQLLWLGLVLLLFLGAGFKGISRRDIARV